ncbi:nitrile hydratase accessory protein [Pseudoroseicyclus sp. H15]
MSRAELDHPDFDAPWQAEAMALAESLKERAVFTAAEWAEALGAERARQAAEGAPDSNEAYFLAVLAALEGLTARAGIAPAARDRRRAAWEEAYRQTRHGDPVTLPPGA